MLGKFRSPAAMFLVLGLGLVLLIWHRQHNAALVLRPPAVPLPQQGGAELTFRASATTDHIVELRVDCENVFRADKAIGKYLLKTRTPSPLKLAWTVRGESGVSARGGAAHYIYLDFDSGWKEDVRYWLLGQEVLNGQLVRGIGRFSATEGQSYTIAMRFIEPVEELAAFHPAISVRLSREHSRQHYQQLKLALVGGIGALIAGAFLAVDLGWRAVWRRVRQAKT